MRLPLFAVIPGLLLLVVMRAAPVGTAFDYQGRLSEGGVPASGTYELRLTLHDAAVAGAQVGPSLTNSPVSVVNGLFTSAIDFGTGVFTGEARWMEIGGIAPPDFQCAGCGRDKTSHQLQQRRLS